MRTWARAIRENTKQFKRWHEPDVYAMGLGTAWWAAMDEDTCPQCRDRDGLLIINVEQLARIKQLHRCTNKADGCRCGLALVSAEDHKNWRSTRAVPAQRQSKSLRIVRLLLRFFWFLVTSLLKGLRKMILLVDEKMQKPKG